MARLHAFAAAVTAGAAAALLFLFGAGLGLSLAGTFLVLASPLPIYVAGLGWGSLAAGGAGAVAVMGATLYGDPLAASVFSVAFVMPAFLLTHLAVSPLAPAAGGGGGEVLWRSASALALALVAIGLTEVAVAALALAAGDAGLAGNIRERLAALMAAAYGVQPGAGDDGAIAAIVDLWDSLVLGAIVAAVMLAHAALGALAQGLVRSAGVLRRPAPVFWRLRLPAWLAVLAAALAITAFALDMAVAGREGPAAFAVYLLTGFLLVLGAGFLLQGLAVLHALTRGMSAQPLVLAGCYMTVLVFQPFGALAFAAVGFAECWAGFRERFGAGMEE